MSAGRTARLPGRRERWGRAVGTVWSRAEQQFRRLGEQGTVWAEVTKMKVMSERRLADAAVPGADEMDDRRFLVRPAILGFVALVLVAVGASLPSSPFKLEQPGAWFFGMPRTPGASGTLLLTGLVAVYGGLVLLLRVWCRLAKVLTRRPDVPVKYLAIILGLWLIPMLIVPPLFSRDVYSYAAQGEMMSHHINPYHYGPQVLGATPYVRPVDKLWMSVPAPYGPLFLIVDGFFASASFHHLLGTVILLRLSALVGVAMIAWCIPKLARLYGRDPGESFVLAVMNPLVVLTLVASGHNDALMIGLLLMGFTLAKQGRPVWGVIVCTLAAAIKAPAELGVLYIGWDWLGTGLPLRQRLRPVATALLISAVVMIALTAVSGLGFGWVGNLATPGTVRSWLAPATGIGMLLAGAAHLAGSGVQMSTVLSVTRFIGLLTAAGFGVYFLVRSDRIGALKAMGLTLLLFVVLGPVVQPWYLTWGLVLLAPVATGRLRTMIIVVSVLSPFIGLPGGRSLLYQLLHSDPLSVAWALVVLTGVLVAPLGPWSRAWRRDGEDTVDLAGGRAVGLGPAQPLTPRRSLLEPGPASGGAPAHESDPI